ncbi:hypothetical protein H4R33_003606 [Dimargaris cristalligena]|uniref:Transmembrane protein n=1 Tax=Dimargaris cristalligena TaxID=215637 RepID=A0A4P9ZRX9_9FUNG|nr:hypothetical protein H4R33_003606 [Dimargaris cristalligena]RKP36284.1 hypothetical protein BJ085DRAFT_37132 [Dimargaris cristalligena]|eukprot:RKP36284.1 hypothetical protein BJ085DRAFT_37132 [Dimargaris cristalligena]
MTSPSPQEQLRRRREARQQKILARGGDRLSRIKHTLSSAQDSLSSDASAAEESGLENGGGSVHGPPPPIGHIGGVDLDASILAEEAKPPQTTTATTTTPLANGRPKESAASLLGTEIDSSFDAPPVPEAATSATFSSPLRHQRSEVTPDSWREQRAATLPRPRRSGNNRSLTSSLADLSDSNLSPHSPSLRSKQPRSSSTSTPTSSPHDHPSAPSTPVSPVRRTRSRTPVHLNWWPLLHWLGALVPVFSLFAYALFVEWTNDTVLDYWDTWSKLASLLQEPPSQILGDWHNAVPLFWYLVLAQGLWLFGVSPWLGSNQGQSLVSTQPLLPAIIPVPMLPPAIQPLVVRLMRVQVPSLRISLLVDGVCWLLFLTGVAVVVSHLFLARSSQLA